MSRSGWARRMEGVRVRDTRTDREKLSMPRAVRVSMKNMSPMDLAILQL